MELLRPARDARLPMPQSRSARVVYLDEVRASAALPALPLSSPRVKRRGLGVWIAVSLALHAAVLALPTPRPMPPELPAAARALEVVIVAAAPETAAPEPERPAPKPPPRPVARVPPRAVPGPVPLPVPAVETAPTPPPVASPPQPPDAVSPSGASSAADAAPLRSEVAATAGAPVARAGAFTPPSFGASYLQNPPPVYPLSARRLGQSGLVVLRVRVNEAGKPVEVRLLESAGIDALDRAALEVVRSWTFVPARQGEVPVAAWVEVPIRFRLTEAR